MNWENSKALTKLKKDFLKEFFSIEKRFFLTGGSALGIFYLDHRFSYDLDFFTCEKNINWKEIEGYDFSAKYADIFKIALIENKPAIGLSSERCICSSPEEISEILRSMQIGFCYDIGHSMCFAKSAN